MASSSSHHDVAAPLHDPAAVQQVPLPAPEEPPAAAGGTTEEQVPDIGFVEVFKKDGQQHIRHRLTGQEVLLPATSEPWRLH
eukprot:746441-Lingulodinium_polyedra.AAC.1